MAQLIADRRDVDFVLFEQMETDTLVKCDRYADFNKKTIELVVSEARNLAVKELLPINKEGDEHGCTFENGTVKVPPSFHKAYKLFCEGEWIAMSDDQEVGGQGLPQIVTLACLEYFTGANCSFGMYPGLAHGAGKLIEVFGTDKQKELFLGKMYAGQWGGSMMLTEADAGSDVGALTTTAKKNDDGTYTISGNKIFITGAEQDMVKNIIHPVLARIEGAPEGTKGISLFIVPKYWVNDDGSMGDFNDVVCTGIEEKMGIHGSCTCSVTLGGKGNCRGLLLGEENKGMRGMFHMMNEARLGVGIQAFAMATSAYMYAVNYAKERKQGKHLFSFADPNAPAVPIIQHADVRRMLLKMKAYVDGMRSFVYFVGKCFDQELVAEDEETKELAKGMVEVLTPVIKGYCSEKSFEVITEAMQVYGGYGYVQEYPISQLLRDCKITSIYEGTNGIQAMDLLGRKLGMKKGKYFMALLGEMNKTIAKAKELELTKELAAKVEEAVNKLGEVALHMGQTAMSPRVLTAFAFAHPFMDATGDVVMAWMHLWRAVVSAPKLEKAVGSIDPAQRKEKAEKNKDAAFYEGQIQTAKYFINGVLPITMGKFASVLACDDSPVDIPEVSFNN